MRICSFKEKSGLDYGNSQNEGDKTIDDTYKSNYTHIVEQLQPFKANDIAVSDNVQKNYSHLSVPQKSELLGTTLNIHTLLFGAQRGDMHYNVYMGNIRMKGF